MRNLIALVLFFLVSRAPAVASVLIGVGLLELLGRGGMPLASGLLLLAIALLGALAVGLACSLPVLRTTNGGRRAVRDACWEAADEIGEWAGWEPDGPPNP